MCPTHELMTPKTNFEYLSWDWETIIASGSELSAVVTCIRVATKFFDGFGGELFKEFIKGREPVSSIHYTRPGSSIKRPTAI